MTGELDPFTRLALEKERTLFMFYGFRSAQTGDVDGGYFKLAHSLSEAMADLEASPAVADEGGFLVADAFLETEDGDPTIHVQVVSLLDIAQRLNEDDEENSDA